MQLIVCYCVCYCVLSLRLPFNAPMYQWPSFLWCQVADTSTYYSLVLLAAADTGLIIIPHRIFHGHCALRDGSTLSPFPHVLTWGSPFKEYSIMSGGLWTTGNGSSSTFISHRPFRFDQMRSSHWSIWSNQRLPLAYLVKTKRTMTDEHATDLTQNHGKFG